MRQQLQVQKKKVRDQDSRNREFKDQGLGVAIERLGLRTRALSLDLLGSPHAPKALNPTNLRVSLESMSRFFKP